MAVHTEHLPGLEPDEGLIERLLEGEEAAFSELYARYFELVYADTAKRVANPADVEERVEEVLGGVFSSLEEFLCESPRVSFTAWVIAVARSVVPRPAR